MFYPDFLQLPHVQHFHRETVCLPTFKKVTKLLTQLPATRISIGAIESNENIGIGSCTLFITCDDDDLIFDRYQASSFACKALDGLCALNGDEIVPLRRKRNEGIAFEKVPGDNGAEQKEYSLTI